MYLYSILLVLLQQEFNPVLYFISVISEFPQAELKEQKFTCKNLRAENENQNDSSQPTLLKVIPPCASNLLAESGNLKDDLATPLEFHVPRRHQRKSSNPQKRNSFQLGKGSLQERPSGMDNCATKKQENAKKNIERRDGELEVNNCQKRSSFQITFMGLKESSDEKTLDLESHDRKKDGDGKDNIKSSDSGVKRKKNGKEEERFTKWLEKMEEKMAKKQGKMEERFTKKHEKLEERLVKKQEKLAERFQKQQEKAEKRRSTTK